LVSFNSKSDTLGIPIGLLAKVICRLVLGIGFGEGIAYKLASANPHIPLRSERTCEFW